MFTVFSAEGAAWRVTSQCAVSGEPLSSIASLAVTPSIEFTARPHFAPDWPLIGRASHVRYVEKAEKDRLVSVQAGLGRPEATCAALIPIRKSDEWWALTQDERREIFETKSQHIAASMTYLPAIARQLYHARDLGQPFDFLTWFEFAPEHTNAFDDLLGMLRGTLEWTYVTREVEFRLTRNSKSSDRHND